ncbi:helix-turn-helix transcriptional regulator (plasmid) [Glaciihabitans sp. INWT7]|uniref:helix-turn-helix transcriptional regulator n=1 Tax=Glaciihabitans sp. INWT7 TaxID=2596912 RepID=UPI001623D56D|nr:helix-turn-helix transcriptional regulator [Glaciihabitans sp. INWT7]QNE48582.1 helix-turn-helix transcriptional regulator [Glaciihabitans sp. INWT7]
MSRFDNDAWRFTQRASPRDQVRVTDPATGAGITNSYPHQVPLAGPTPSTPWAMYLAGADGMYRFVCFDLDASHGNAANDADRLSFWLADLNVSHLVCESGPTGGRHVWLALDHGADPAVIEQIGRMAAQLLPSLDITPLTNPRTGCVRPPGAPHRLGGFSTVLAGTLTAFIFPSVTADDLTALRSFLADSGATLDPPRTSPAKGMAFDTAGHPHLLGPRRVLTSRARTLLDSEPEADTSVTLARALAMLARARWRYSDVAALLPSSPALVHARSIAGRGARRPVSEHAAARRLAAAWSRAVYFAAANPFSVVGNDDDFLERATQVTAAVAACQARADSMPGIWGFDTDSRPARADRGRRTHRLVLDAICLYLTQSVQSTVEVDTRRLAEDTGYGRESCRLALLALAAPSIDGDAESAWIVKTEDSVGIHGSRFRLSHRFSTESEDQSWAQVMTRPAELPLENRQWWIQKISSLLAPLASDTFAAPGSLGRTAGRVFAQLRPGAAVTAADIARRAQTSPGQALRALRELDRSRLAHLTDEGWARDETADLESAAWELGVTGYLDGRRDRYATERAVWSWWHAEHTWMTTRGKRRRGKQGGTALALFAQTARTEYPFYPRGADRRADHRKAKQLAAAGALRAPDIWAA